MRFDALYFFSNPVWTTKNSATAGSSMYAGFVARMAPLLLLRKPAMTETDSGYMPRNNLPQ